MKLPRDISGRDLIAALSKLDYKVTRQSGSHVRLTTERNGTHHITIPEHRPIKLAHFQRSCVMLRSITN